jgi:hypothetical protein
MPVVYVHFYVDRKPQPYPRANVDNFLAPYVHNAAVHRKNPLLTLALLRALLLIFYDGFSV